MKTDLLLGVVIFGSFAITSCQQSREKSFFKPQENQNQNVVYGTDDRKDYRDVTDPQLRELARSTVALISKEHLIYDDVFDVFHFEKPDGSLPLCSEEPFNNQSTWAFCSGSLIAPDLILTAGHCVFDQKSCQKARFVFDYKLEGRENKIDLVKAENVFSCQEIIYSTETRNAADFALIRLDREVANRTPLELSDKEVTFQDKLMLIGHPAGYPTKFAFNGVARRMTNDQYIVAEIDAFTGNSGSSVFDQTTHKIVGVLARGEADYERKNKCLVAKVCGKEGCRGEDVTRIDVVKKYLPQN